MSDFKLVSDEKNVWEGNLQDFNINVANNFYSYGFPSGYDAMTQGGGGSYATVVFDAEDFFEIVVDADIGRDMNALAPADFKFVQDFFNGTSGLKHGSYTAAELRKAGFTNSLSISGNLYDTGSNFGNSRLDSFEVAFTIGSYSVRIADSATFHVGPVGVSITGFDEVTAGDYDTACQQRKEFESFSPAANFWGLPTEFSLESGENIKRGYLAFETWGTPNSTGDNSILVFSGMSSGSHMVSSDQDPCPGWWESAVGSSKPIDSRYHHVICISMLGSCYGSTGPASRCPQTGTRYGTLFPHLTIDDQSRAVVEFLRHMKIDRLRAVIGLSMGGCLAKAFLKHFVGKIDLLSLVSSALAPSPHAQIWRDIQIKYVTDDPNWNGGDYTANFWPRSGMLAARALGLTTYTGAQNLENLGNTLEGFVNRKANEFVSRFDPLCFVRLQEMQNAFVFAGPVRSQIGMVHILGSTTDILFPPYQQSAVARFFRELGYTTKIDILHSGNGHDMFLREPVQVAQSIADHLPSVKSRTPKRRGPALAMTRQPGRIQDDIDY